MVCLFGWTNLPGQAPEYEWVKQLGGSQHQYSNDTAVDNWGDIYVTGEFQGTADFDPGPADHFLTAVNGNNTVDFNPGTGINELTSFGLSDAFIHKMSQSCIAPIDISLTQDLDVCEGETVNLVASGGTNFLWSTGNTTTNIIIEATTDQTYIVTVTDNNGCSGVDSVTVFVYPLSETNLTSTTCDSSMAGTFTAVLADQNGCDSIVTLEVSLMLPPEAPIAPSDLVIQPNEPSFELTIAEIPGATAYVWSVPSGVQILSGAGTNTILVDWTDGPLAGGDICVSAINECGSSATDCTTIAIDLTDGLYDLDPTAYSVFPNPTTGEVFVKLPLLAEAFLTVTDCTGKLLLEKQFSEEAVIGLSHVQKGLYILAIRTEEQRQIERIVKL